MNTEKVVKIAIIGALALAVWKIWQIEMAKAPKLEAKGAVKDAPVPSNSPETTPTYRDQIHTTSYGLKGLMPSHFMDKYMAQQSDAILNHVG